MFITEQQAVKCWTTSLFGPKVRNSCQDWISEVIMLQQSKRKFFWISCLQLFLTQIEYWVHFNFCKYHHHSLVIMESVIKQYNPNILLMRLWNSEGENILCYLEHSAFLKLQTYSFQKQWKRCFCFSPICSTQ